MDSVILRTAIRFLFPLLLLSSVFLFLRGHNFDYYQKKEESRGMKHTSKGYR